MVENNRVVLVSCQPTFANGRKPGSTNLSAWRVHRLNHFTGHLCATGQPSPETLEILEQSCRETKRVRARSNIVLAGTPSGHLHILLSGWACRTQTLADGRRQITAFLLPGDICDLDSLHIDPPAECVSALTECEVVAIPTTRLKQLLRRDAGFAEALGWFAAREKVVLGARIASLGQRPARERIAHLLCELVTRLRAGGEAEGESCRVPLTQEQLGEALGLTTVHVNRVLQDLRAAGVVSRDGDRLTIHDWDALRAIGCFCPEYLHLSRRASGQRLA